MCAVGAALQATCLAAGTERSEAFEGRSLGRADRQMNRLISGAMTMTPFKERTFQYVEAIHILATLGSRERSVSI